MTRTLSLTSGSAASLSRRPSNKGDSGKKSVSSRSRTSIFSGTSLKGKKSSRRRCSSRQRSLRSNTGTDGSSRTPSMNFGGPGPSQRKASSRRSRSGKRHVENRFFEDLQKAADKKNDKETKKKKALNDLRSNGVKYKCDGLVNYSQKSGYKVSATFLPTWGRGKPHVVLSKNWKKEDRPLKPSGKKQYVKGFEEVQGFSEMESEADDEDERVLPKKGNLIKSPNVAKPMASAAAKGAKKKPIRCTICNSTYRENTNVLWMFCGGADGKKCNKLAIHAACHFVIGKNQNEIDEMCKKFIRCFDCRQIEKFKKGPNKKGRNEKVPKQKAQRSQSTDSMADFQ